uniref:Fatty acid hydroxylase domain-containing protein n=1 Tax=Chromera velia CCMP2878 TaxID=1169474 RepID=A0A0G4ICG7_9ALVE|eukprot:Cvel_13032.t1-p1 / transcript=Cvel_13032.t1 / gene=Cvel_13032 / organism=Chromera_velia_CCMP2878 / gene_product=Fatty acid 2-hydroxylase 2, putative / transcript_product=Fatty acid 2-hydroxylase 2, putative / location=Cvel_scaffold875:19552-20247(+) / protein_length=232 / sequence_SO=supercontig / SO=protein_coding / is_pseudo=false
MTGAAPVPHTDPRSSLRFYLFHEVLKMEPYEYERWCYDSTTPKVHDVRERPEDDPEKFGYWGKCRPWVPFVFWPPVIAVLAWWGGFALLPFVVGSLLWFPIERLFHQHLFHLKVRGPVTMKFHLMLHGVHHLATFDLNHIVSPPPELGLQLLAVAFVLYLVRVPNVPMVCAALLVSYLRYDFVHWMVHRYQKKQLVQVPLVGGLLGRLKDQHMEHHFHDPQSNFVISFLSPF